MVLGGYSFARVNLTVKARRVARGLQRATCGYGDGIGEKDVERLWAAK